MGNGLVLLIRISKALRVVAVLLAALVFLMLIPANILSYVLTGSTLPTVVAKLLCGASYMLVLDPGLAMQGRLTDSACGFNADMMTIFFSLFFLLLSAGMFIAGSHPAKFLRALNNNKKAQTAQEDKQAT